MNLKTSMLLVCFQMRVTPYLCSLWLNFQVLNSKSGRGKSSHQTVLAIKSKGKSTKKIPEVCSLPLITADQYASRSAMLSSLVVAWSPLLKLSSEMCLAPENNSCNCFSLLAVGAKSGKISLWRIHAPQYYSIEQSGAPTAAELIGILQAHNSWVTTISWAFLASDSSNPQLLLATGSFDGRWVMCAFTSFQL